MRQVNLAQLYREFNQQFWNGRLPEYRVMFHSLSGNVPGECLTDRRLIRIDPSLKSKPDALRRVFLHEMCHVGTGTGHGKKFQAALMRLAKQGEDWAKAEAEQVQGRPSWNDQMRHLKYDLIDIATLSAGRYPPFRQVAKILAFLYGQTPASFLRAVPWLKASWQKARKDAEREEKLRAKQQSDRGRMEE